MTLLPLSPLPLKSDILFLLSLERLERGMIVIALRISCTGRPGPGQSPEKSGTLRVVGSGCALHLRLLLSTVATATTATTLDQHVSCSTTTGCAVVCLAHCSPGLSLIISNCGDLKGLGGKRAQTEGWPHSGPARFPIVYFSWSSGKKNANNELRSNLSRRKVG